jgi:hypothetical protein
MSMVCAWCAVQTWLHVSVLDTSVLVVGGGVMVLHHLGMHGSAHSEMGMSATNHMTGSLATGSLMHAAVTVPSRRYSRRGRA